MLIDNLVVGQDGSVRHQPGAPAKELDVATVQDAFPSLARRASIPRTPPGGVEFLSGRFAMRKWGGVG